MHHAQMCSLILSCDYCKCVFETWLHERLLYCTFQPNPLLYVLACQPFTLQCSVGGHVQNSSQRHMAFQAHHIFLTSFLIRFFFVLFSKLALFLSCCILSPSTPSLSLTLTHPPLPRVHGVPIAVWAPPCLGRQTSQRGGMSKRRGRPLAALAGPSEW